MTPAQHLTRSCEVKAHTRSLPVKRSALDTNKHRELASELAPQSPHCRVRVKQLRPMGRKAGA